jgi:tetratricopeptide (TPR) repeat protein
MDARRCAPARTPVMADSSNDRNPNAEPDRATLRARLAGWMGSLRALPEWVRANRLRSLLLLGGVGLVVAVACAAFLGLMSLGRHEYHDITLADALASLDQGVFEAAREQARALRKSENLSSLEWGGPAFVEGAATAREAQMQWNPNDRERMYLVASRLLEEAYDRGFPPGRRGEGLLLLGESLYHSGQFAVSLPVLNEALAESPKDKTQIHGLLARAYFRDANPDLARALEHADRHLAGAGLSPDERAAAMLLKSQILFDRKDYDGCRAVLAATKEVVSARAEAVVMHGRLLMHEAELASADPDLKAAGQDKIRASAKYHEAISVLRKAQAADTLSNQATRKAQYLIGVAYRRMEDVRAARDQLQLTRKKFYDTPEGLAAGLEEAEVLREMASDTEAIAAYRAVLAEAGRPESFSNPWFTLDDFRRRIIGTYTHYLEGGKYELAVQLAESMSPMWPLDEALQRQAEALHAWGRHLADQAAHVGEPQGDPLQAKARRQFRAAGASYARLAQLRITTREYPEELWRSADNFLQGHDFEGAVQMFREYLKIKSRDRVPNALMGLGEALLSLGQTDESLAALRECMELHPRSPVVYRSRLLAAQAYSEQGKLDDAEKLLKTNLHFDNLTPGSLEWRDSLFALGRLFHRRGIMLVADRRFRASAAAGELGKEELKILEQSAAAFHESIERLSEAVARYADARQAIEARYMIAKSHREAAALPRRKMAAVSIETTRVALNKEFQREMYGALAAYNDLVKILNSRGERGTLSRLEQTILRNCYFARGAILLDLAQHEDAILAFSTATNRYPNDPASLEAFVQIATCYRRLNRPVEARGTIEQAKFVLKRFPAETPFAQTTRYNRDDWARYLDWLGTM